MVVFWCVARTVKLYLGSFLKRAFSHRLSAIPWPASLAVTRDLSWRCYSGKPTKSPLCLPGHVIITSRWVRISSPVERTNMAAVVNEAHGASEFVFVIKAFAKYVGARVHVIIKLLEAMGLWQLENYFSYQFLWTYFALFSTRNVFLILWYFFLWQIFELNGSNVGVQVINIHFLPLFRVLPTRNNVVKLSSTNCLFCLSHSVFKIE